MAKSNNNMSSRSKKPFTEVPGQALGYGLQYTRLTELLFNSPAGSFCSMEYLDDVAQQAENDVHLIQSKSALTSNPVSDRAKSLWKTLYNWTLKAGLPEVDVKNTIFEIYISRPAGGQIVEAFSKASTLEDARAAILMARDFLWGEYPDFALKNSVSDEIKPYLEYLFTEGATYLEQIICNFQLTNGSGSPQADIESIIRSHPVSASRVSNIADHMCGVVKRRVDELLELGKPAIISRDDFYGWYNAYVRKIDRDTVLPSMAKAPSEKELHDQLPKVFVQQLELIELPFEDKLEAASDYLMAAADRTAWAVSGDVDESSFEDLDTQLKRTWRNKKRTCGIEHSSQSEEIQGQALYSDCMTYTSVLQAMQPTSHFIPGCFHRLADDMSIGWHPNYEHQLKMKKDR